MGRYAVKAFACLAVALATVAAKPAWRDVSQVEDTAIVGSNLWEVAVAAPDDLSASGTEHGSHRGGGGHHGDQGFYKSKATKGDNGYKSFDSYHKKDGDSYGYEQHHAFGSAKGNKEAAAHQHATKYQEGDEDGGHNRKRRQHEYGGHEGAGGGGGEHGGYEHHGVGEHSSDHHGGHHTEHHSSGGGGSHHGGGGGGHHGFF